MKATELYAQIAPFGLLCNKNALSANYRTLLLTPKYIRGCAAFGIMETEVELGIENEIYVDSESFLQVIRSLSAEELELKVTANTLQWKCGSARGQLAHRQGGFDIPELVWDEELTEVQAQFPKGLEIGSIACGSTAFLSVGLYGVLIDNNETLSVYASDDTTISSCSLGEGISDSAAVATLSPDATQLLIALSKKGKAQIKIDATSIYCAIPKTRLLLKQIAPLKHDIKTIAAGFTGTEISLDLDRQVIAAFIRRAEALTEDNKGRAGVAISVDNGATKLEFNEGTSSSEQFYLVEGAPDVRVDPIIIEAKRMSKALSQATSIVFDYAKRGALVLHGPNEFMFLISGKRATA